MTDKVKLIKLVDKDFSVLNNDGERKEFDLTIKSNFNIDDLSNYLNKMLNKEDTYLFLLNDKYLLKDIQFNNEGDVDYKNDKLSVELINEIFYTTTTIENEENYRYELEDDMIIELHKSDEDEDEKIICKSYIGNIYEYDTIKNILNPQPIFDNFKYNNNNNNNNNNLDGKLKLLNNSNSNSNEMMDFKRVDNIRVCGNTMIKFEKNKIINLKNNETLIEEFNNNKLKDEEKSLIKSEVEEVEILDAFLTELGILVKINKYLKYYALELENELENETAVNNHSTTTKSWKKSWKFLFDIEFANGVNISLIKCSKTIISYIEDYRKFVKFNIKRRTFSELDLINSSKGSNKSSNTYNYLILNNGFVILSSFKGIVYYIENNKIIRKIENKLVRVIDKSYQFENWFICICHNKLFWYLISDIVLLNEKDKDSLQFKKMKIFDDKINDLMFYNDKEMVLVSGDKIFKLNI